MAIVSPKASVDTPRIFVVVGAVPPGQVFGEGI